MTNLINCPLCNKQLSYEMFSKSISYRCENPICSNSFPGFELLSFYCKINKINNEIIHLGIKILNHDKFYHAKINDDKIFRIMHILNNHTEKLIFETSEVKHLNIDELIKYSFKVVDKLENLKSFS